MSYPVLARKSEAPPAGDVRLSSKVPSRNLKISEPNDIFEREADRVSNTVSSGGRVPGWSLTKVGFGQIQRQTPPTPPTSAPQPNNYKEGAGKLAEAFLQTDVGKELKNAVTSDPLVKGATDFIGTLPGKIIAGAAATGAVATMAATHTPLPAQIPEIPLDTIRPGLKVKVTYEGPVDRPSKAMVTFSYTPGGDKKKSPQKGYGAEIARLTAEREQIREGLKSAPGSPQDLQQKQDQKMIEDYTLHRFGALPGTGGVPLAPAAPGLQPPPDTGLRVPTFQSPFQPKAHSLLDKKLELKPFTSSIPTPSDAKREEVPVQRKADSGAAVVENPIAMDEVLRSSGRPLDPETRSFMESRIGFDFSKVRIHAESRAAESAKAMGALAYTVGDRVVFGAGRFSPHTTEGRKLIAHELAHTVQQERSVPAAAPPIRAISGRKSTENADRDREFPVLASGEANPATKLVPLSRAADNLQREQERRIASVHAKGPIRFRVPTTADLKALFTSGTVPEDVLKDRIQLALTRMAEEKHLKTTDSVADVMKKIFPAAGVFDEAAYEAAVDVTDRTRVYQNVLDAEAKVTSADKPKLKTTMGDAAKLIDDCAADATNLQSVFGTKKDVAKAVYVKAKAALDGAITNIDTNVTTDYNLDDPETGLGGWATFSDQHVHFQAAVTKVTDEAGAKITIIHESSHLADSSVEDKGYYGSPGFEGKAEDVKVTNAAHYEEIPRRKLDKSKYKGADGNFVDFKPGTSAGGASQTFEEKVKEKAVDHFRLAWDKGVDVAEFIRKIRIAEMAGNHAPFNAHKARILELSKLMHLTVHEQPPATASVNQVDMVVAEGVPRAMGKMQRLAKTQTVASPFQLKTPPLNLGFQRPQPSLLNQRLQLQPIPGLDTSLPVIPTEDEAANQVIDDTIMAFGTLTGDFADDKALVDWLAAEFKKPL